MGIYDLITVLVGMFLAIIIIALYEWKHHESKSAWDQMREKGFDGDEGCYERLTRSGVFKGGEDEIRVIVNGSRHCILESLKDGRQMLFSDKGLYWREKSSDDWIMILDEEDIGINPDEVKNGK